MRLLECRWPLCFLLMPPTELSSISFHLPDTTPTVVRSLPDPHPVYINDRICISLALTVPPLCLIVLAAIFLYFFHISNAQSEGRSSQPCPPPVAPATSPPDLHQSDWSGLNNISTILSTPVGPMAPRLSPSRPFSVRIRPLEEPELTSTPSHRQFRQTISFNVGDDESAVETTSSSTSRQALQGSHISHYLLYPFISYHTVNSPFHPCFNTPTSDRDESPIGQVPQAPIKRRPPTFLDDPISPEQSVSGQALQPRRLFENSSPPSETSSQHEEFEEDSLSTPRAQRSNPRGNPTSHPPSTEGIRSNSLEWDYFQTTEYNRRKPPLLQKQEYWI